MTLDYTGADTVGRMSGFAAGCTATYVFVRNMVMKPAIKSCHAQIAELRETCDWLKEQLGLKDNRIGQLETILLSHGNGAIRSAVQAALSEQRLETERHFKAVEKKIGDEQ